MYVSLALALAQGRKIMGGVRKRGENTIVVVCWGYSKHPQTAFNYCIDQMRTSMIGNWSGTSSTCLFVIAEKPPVFSVADSYVIGARRVSPGVSSLLRDAPKACWKELPETSDGQDGVLNKLSGRSAHCLSGLSVGESPKMKLHIGGGKRANKWAVYGHLRAYVPARG